jgi:hypothetical protein
MGYPNLPENFAAATQAEMRKSIIQTKQQKAPTSMSITSGAGARGESGKLAGLEIPFKNGVQHGETALDVLSGTTSFEQPVAPLNDKMFVGLAQTGFTVHWEHFHEKDAQAGNLPESRFDQRDQAMRTYYQHKNWYHGGVKTGSVAVVAAGGGGGSGTITFANDNTARGRSKGSLRLAVSPGTTAGKRILYQSYTESTDTLTATFYITSKASTTTAVIVVTDAGTVVAGDVIVKYGHYKKVTYGLGYLCDYANRFLQGVSTATYGFLNARRVNGGNALITPTLMDTAKGYQMTMANDMEARKKRGVHMSIGNYKQLAAFSYTLRQYNAEKGQADVTYGMPNWYEDEDAVFFCDADFEDAYVYIRDRKSVFEYRQSEMQKISKGDGSPYVGTSSFGSTEFFDNYGESCNLAWDARGDDGKGSKDGAGSPNSMVVIDNLAIPAVSQMAIGVSLV